MCIYERCGIKNILNSSGLFRYLMRISFLFACLFCACPSIIMANGMEEYLQHPKRREGTRRGRSIERAKTILGWNDLLVAVADGNLEKVHDLLEKGADANSADVFGRTALNIANAYGHEETANMLLQYGNACMSLEMAKMQPKFAEAIDTDNANLLRNVLASRMTPEAVRKFPTAPEADAYVVYFAEKGCSNLLHYMASGGYRFGIQDYASTRLLASVIASIHSDGMIAILEEVTPDKDQKDQVSPLATNYYLINSLLANGDLEFVKYMDERYLHFDKIELTNNGGHIYFGSIGSMLRNKNKEQRFDLYLYLEKKGFIIQRYTAQPVGRSADIEFFNKWTRHIETAWNLTPEEKSKIYASMLSSNLNWSNRLSADPDVALAILDSYPELISTCDINHLNEHMSGSIRDNYQPVFERIVSLTSSARMQAVLKESLSDCVYRLESDSKYREIIKSHHPDVFKEWMEIKEKSKQTQEAFEDWGQYPYESLKTVDIPLHPENKTNVEKIDSAFDKVYFEKQWHIIRSRKNPRSYENAEASRYTFRIGKNGKRCFLEETAEDNDVVHEDSFAFAWLDHQRYFMITWNLRIAGNGHHIMRRIQIYKCENGSYNQIAAYDHGISGKFGPDDPVSGSLHVEYNPETALFYVRKTKGHSSISKVRKHSYAPFSPLVSYIYLGDEYYNYGYRCTTEYWLEDENGVLKATKALETLIPNDSGDWLLMDVAAYFHIPMEKLLSLNPQNPEFYINTPLVISDSPRLPEKTYH